RKSVNKFAPLKALDWNSRSGTIGKLDFASTAKKSAKPVKPTIKDPRTTGWLPPRRAESMNPVTSAAKPMVAMTAPGQSILRAPALRLSGTCLIAITTTAVARGKLIKNAQRQEACSTSQPPKTGPIAVVIAVNADQVPIARPRSFSSNEAL